MNKVPGQVQVNNNNQYQTKVNSPSESQKNKLFRGKSLILFLSMGFVIVFLLIMVVYLVMNQDKPTVDDDEEEEKTEIVEEDDNQQKEVEDNKEEEPIENEKKKIAYLKNKDLWIINEDGSEKKQITTNAQASSFSWKNDEEISYGECKSLCKIKTVNINSKKHTEEVVFEEFTQNIIAIDWSKDEKRLAYFYTDKDSDRHLTVKNNLDYDEYISFGPSQPKDSTFEDEVKVEFSPEKYRLLLVNTYLDEDDEDTLFIFDEEGKDIKQFKNATFGSFISNNSFIFKSLTDNLLSKFVIGTDSLTSNLITYPIAYDPIMSPDLDFVSFWKINAENKAELYFHDMAKSPGFIGTNLAKAQWLNGSKTLVSLEVEPNIKSFVGFESNGLVKVERVGGKVTVLDEGAIYDFEVK